ncbi:MAG: hypothetical protein O6922_02950 [Chloroflexi bacterium]|nr:hypothetical protein [Chloroflexota bacterium]
MFRQLQTRANRLVRLRAAGLFAVVVVFGILGVGTANADAGSAPGSAGIEAIFGTAVEVRPPDAIVVATSAGLLTLNFNELSELKIGSNIALVADVVEGDRVISTARRNAQGDLIALKTVIQIANSQPVTKHIVGVVTDATDEELSIQTRNGDVVVVLISAGVGAPSVGDGITLVAQLDRSSGVLTARGFELTSKTVERLEVARDRAADQADRERLAQIAIDARSKHLSALDDAARALQRVIDAGRVDSTALDQAVTQINEIQRRFRELKRIYDRAARDRNEELPVLTISGALVLENGEAAFTIVPRGEQDADPFLVKFLFDPEVTTVSIPDDWPGLISVEVEGQLLLADVKHLIGPASELDVKYSIEDGIRSAVSVRVRPPRLFEELEAVINNEAHRAFHGVITLVEVDDSLAGAIGIVIAANERLGIKVAAKVTDETEVTLDGETSDISALATGQAVDIQFESSDLSSLSDITASGVTLRALAIRARTTTPDEEMHISGIVESVDVEASAITIRPIDGSLIRLTVGEDVPTVRNGRPVVLADIREGDLVIEATRYDPASETLTRLVAVARTNVKFAGTITGIGQEPARLRVTGENVRTINVLVTADTLLVLDDRRVDFGDLQTRLRVVSGEYAVAGRNGAFYNVATIVTFESPKVGRATGIITNVNVTSGSLTVLSGQSSETRVLRLHLPEMPFDDVLQKDGLPIESLKDVERGDRIDIVVYEIETGLIKELSVVSDNFIRSRGRLLEVSSNLRFVRVELADGNVFELWVGPGSVVNLNGRRIQSFSAVVDMLTREGAANTDVSALIPQVLFIRDSLDSDRGVIITMQIQIKVDAASGGDGDVDNPVVEVTISGVIEAIDGQTWVIDGHVFFVDKNTEFLGEEPEVGLVAKAALISRPGRMLVAQAVSVAGRPDISPTRRPIDVRPDSSGSAGEPGAADDTSTIFEIRGEITRVDDRVIVVETVEIIIGEAVEVNFDLLKVGATVRVKVRRIAGGLVNAAALEVLRPAPQSDDPTQVPEIEANLPPRIDQIISRFAGGLDETDGPVARLGDDILIVPSNVVASVLIGGTANLESRFKVTLVKRSDLASVIGSRQAAQLAGNRILETYTDDATHPLYLVEFR